jgi:hypothetical protein
MKSFSSRKYWDIFALSIEKIDFFIFAYTNFRGHLKEVIQPRGHVRFGLIILTIWFNYFLHPS